MSSVPLTFNNGQTATTSDIAVINESGKNKLTYQFVDSNYVVSVLVKDGVDKNNRPLYERQIRSFDTVNEAKTFKETVDRDGLNSEAYSIQSFGKKYNPVIA